MLSWQLELRGFKQKQRLEKKEAELRAEKEQLELETQMAANTAKLSILKGFEMSQIVHEPIENMDGMNEYLEAGLAQQSFQQEKSDKQDEFEDAELTQAYNQPATTLDSTTVEDVPQETATRTQEETVKTITHGSLTVDASVRKKIIHPHQIDYAPLGTQKYVTHDTKAPVGVTKDHRPPKTSTIRSSNLFARSSTHHDYMSHGTGTLGGVGTTTQHTTKKQIYNYP